MMMMVMAMFTAFGDRKYMFLQSKCFGSVSNKLKLSDSTRRCEEMQRMMIMVVMSKRMLMMMMVIMATMMMMLMMTTPLQIQGCWHDEKCDIPGTKSKF